MILWFMRKYFERRLPYECCQHLSCDDTFARHLCKNVFALLPCKTRPVTSLGHHRGWRVSEGSPNITSIACMKTTVCPTHFPGWRKPPCSSNSYGLCGTANVQTLSKVRVLSYLHLPLTLKPKIYKKHCCTVFVKPEFLNLASAYGNLSNNPNLLALTRLSHYLALFICTESRKRETSFSIQ